MKIMMKKLMIALIPFVVSMTIAAVSADYCPWPWGGGACQTTK